MLTKTVAVFCACALLLIAVDLVVPGEESEIFDSVIRLHVVAESNSEYDQAVKLKVRDAILENYSEIFISESDIASASDALLEMLPEIKKLADNVLRENNAPYTAQVEFGRENYPEKSYGDITLPSGNYISLRINLGSAAGENWWCVMFPPICVSASRDLSETGISKNDIKVFKNKKYLFRFKLLEFFG